MYNRTKEDEGEEEVAICACCGDTDIGEVFSGDEGWTVCQSCRAVEQGYEYISMAEAIKRGLV